MLTCGMDDRPDLVLQEGGRGIASYTFGVNDPNTFEEIEAQFKERRVEFRRMDSLVPRIDAILELTSPSGVSIAVAASGDDATGIACHERGDGVALLDTDHVTLTVQDVLAYANWLQRVFGFHIADAIAAPTGTSGWIAAWAHVTDQHHDVAMTATPDPTTLNHVAFLAKDLNHMGEVADRVCSLGTQRCEWGIGKHGGLGANNYLYFRDPSGNRVEVTSSMKNVPFDLETTIYRAEELHEFISRWDYNGAPDTMLKGT